MKAKGVMSGFGVAFVTFCIIYPAILADPVLGVLAALLGVILSELISLSKKPSFSEILIAAMFLAAWASPYGFLGGAGLWQFFSRGFLKNKKYVFYMLFGYSIGVILIFK